MMEIKSHKHLIRFGLIFTWVCPDITEIDANPDCIN